MKIGRDPKADPERVAAAREAIGDEAELFVDANGAYSRKQALELAYVFSELDVSWFEEPVSSDDLAGLHLMRNDGPPGIDIAAGEYSYGISYFKRMRSASHPALLPLRAGLAHRGRLVRSPIPSRGIFS